MDSKLRKAAEEEVIPTPTPKPKPKRKPNPNPNPNFNPNQAMFTAKLRTDALAYEQKLTEAYEAHKSAVQSRSLELASKDEELQQGQQAMHPYAS